jgi:hypothetical protein
MFYTWGEARVADDRLKNYAALRRMLKRPVQRSSRGRGVKL